MKLENRPLPPTADQKKPQRTFDTFLRQLGRTPKPTAPGPVTGPAPSLRPAPPIGPAVLPGATLPPTTLQTVALQSAAVAERKLADARGLDTVIGLGREQSERFDSVLALAHGETRTSQESRQSVQLRERLFDALERQSKASEAGTPKTPDELPRADAPGPALSGAERAGAAEPVKEAARSEAVMAMVEKIELLLRSQSPALSLELRSSAAAHLEVTRTGPKKVSILLRARGATERRELEQATETLRAALAGRGVQVGSLRIV